MAKGILSKPSKALRAETKDVQKKGGGLGPITAAEIAARTTPAQRHKWAHDYCRAYHLAMKRKMGGM